VGKTWISQKLVQILNERNYSIQVIKAVETGVTEPDQGDIAFIQNGIVPNKKIEAHTLYQFKEPMAPLDASILENRELVYEELLDKTKSLSNDFDYRIIEGAGGISVPLSSDGKDWQDFAIDIGAVKIFLVVENKLGAINQSRLVHHYCKKAAIQSIEVIVILNQINPSTPDTILESNSRNLKALNIPFIQGSELSNYPFIERFKN
jgi:dethiobiotin synthetase